MLLIPEMKVLSLHNDSLLVGNLELTEYDHANGWLYIYNVLTGDRMSSVKTPGPAHSALLAHTGNIVCTVAKRNTVYVLSPVTGEVLVKTSLRKPQLLCVDDKGMMYLSDLTWLYRSSDGGKAWRPCFSTPNATILKMISVGHNSNGDSVF